MLPHIDALTPAELFLIFQQSGLLSNATRKTATFVKALATGRFPREELEQWVAGDKSLPDAFIDNRELTLEEVEGEDPVEDFDAVPSVARDDADQEDAQDAALPVVQAKDALAALEHAVIATSDEEAVAFLVASAKAKLWRHAYLDASAAASQARAFVSGEYATAARQAFLDELNAAQVLHIPDGYAFSIDGEIAKPNLMQRVVAVRVRDGKRFGNWSGTGAGKTLSAVLATRVVGAALTVVCCPNAVVENWSKEITRIFPGSEVETKTWEPSWTTTHPRYLVLNYEMFQQDSSEGSLKRFLDGHVVDFVVIDEVHYARQRHVENMSRRKKLVMGLVAAAGEANPELRVLGLSATPVINNLQEGRSLVELITGIEHEDLKTKATVPNCMRLHQKLVTLGTRWMPDYTKGGRQLQQRTVEVDCSDFLEEIRALPKGASPLELEKLLTQARLPTIVAELQHGRRTLLYTHYVEGVDKLLYDAVRDAGFTAGFYTGTDKGGLAPFLDGQLDVLIGSSSIGTGVDGLQHVCDHLVVNILPWTNAEFEQLKGRIWRQGQGSKRVEVVIPVTHADAGGERWSYCESKLNRLRYKKSIADAAVDGVVPEGNLRTPAQAQRDLMAWLDRLSRGQTEEVIRRRIVVPLSDEPVEVASRLARYGDFSVMNQRWNTSRSTTLAERLATDPEEWAQYHTLYRAARQTWAVVPYMEVARWLAKREGYTVADFGCGEALLAAEVGDRHVVHSLDHVAINESVIAGDMAHTPLDDESVDVAVFSLSLMGANFADYLREAHRVLALDGRLHIWEATSRFDDAKRFAEDLLRLGFGAVAPQEVGPFTHFEALKRDAVPDPEFRLRFREADSSSSV